MKEVENINEEQILIDPATDVSVTIPTENIADDLGIGFGIFEKAKVNLLTRFQPRNFAAASQNTFEFYGENYEEFYIWLIAEKGMSVDEAYHITNDHEKLADAVEEFNDFIRETAVQELDSDGNTVAASPEKLMIWPNLYKATVDKLAEYTMPNIDYSDPKQMEDYAGQSLLIGNILQTCYTGMEQTVVLGIPHGGAEVFAEDSRRFLEKSVSQEELQRCEELANNAFAVTAHLQAGYENLVLTENRQEKTLTIHNLDDIAQVRYAINGMDSNRINGKTISDAAERLENNMHIFGPVKIETSQQQVGDQMLPVCKVTEGMGTAAIKQEGILKDQEKTFAFLKKGKASDLSKELDAFINVEDPPVMDALTKCEEELTQEARENAEKKAQDELENEADQKEQDDPVNEQQAAEPDGPKEDQAVGMVIPEEQKEEQKEEIKEEQKEQQKEEIKEEIKEEQIAPQQQKENREIVNEQPGIQQPEKQADEVMREKWKQISKVNNKIALLQEIGDMHRKLVADREALISTQKDKNANFDQPGKKATKEEGSEYYRNMTRALNKVIALTDLSGGQEKTGDFRQLQQALREYKTAATQYEKTRNVFYKAVFGNGKKRLETSQKAMDKTERFLETMEVYEKRGTLGPEFMGSAEERKSLTEISAQTEKEAKEVNVSFGNLHANAQARQIKDEHAKVADQRTQMRRLVRKAANNAGAAATWDDGILSGDSLPKNWDRAADFLKWSYNTSIDGILTSDKGERMLAGMQKEKFNKNYEKEIKRIAKDRQFREKVISLQNPKEGFEVYEKVYMEKLRLKDKAIKLKIKFKKQLEDMSMGDAVPFMGLEGRVTNAIFEEDTKNDLDVDIRNEKVFSHDQVPDRQALDAGYEKLGEIVTLQILSGEHSVKMRKAIVKNGEGDYKNLQDAVTDHLKKTGELEGKSYAELNEQLGPKLSDGSLSDKVFRGLGKELKRNKELKNGQPEQRKNLQNEQNKKMEKK
ncbi:MAG: hypothetical protein IKR58_03160 [Lachnospiraceae bacterium]|nr:hypothetical protein [Lachnospiraceae bacterium]